MAKRYRKRSFKRRRPSKRRGGVRRRQLKRTIKRVIGSMAETKWAYYTVATNFDASIPYGTALIANMPQGVDEGDRIGNEVMMKRATVSWGIILFNSTNTVYTNIRMRIIIGYFINTPNNVNSITTLDILDKQDINSRINFQQFKAIYDKTRRLTSQTFYSTTGFRPTFDGKISIPWRKKWDFRLATNNSLPNTDFTKYLLYFIITDWAGAANTVSYSIDLQCKLSFVDL